MLTFTGKYNSANVMIDELDETTVQQIYSFLNHPAFAHSYIAIMPDCQAGVGAVIGFTMKRNDYVIPNVVGVDIGWAVLTYRLEENQNIFFPTIDSYIKNNVPSGFSHYQKAIVNLKASSDWQDYAEVCDKLNLELSSIERQIGTLGGGNHFIEIDKDDEGRYWLVIHSGSRNFGLRVATYHQNKAKDLMKTMFIGADAYKKLEYLPLALGGEEYLKDMEIAQRFALRNRETIARTILGGYFNYDNKRIRNLERIESVHNYINFEDNIIRKGAISAHHNEKVIIPFNMRDGVAIGTGRENRKWNFSAPHGAGRTMSRRKAKETISLEDFKKEMEGIYTTTVNIDTLDEAPMAYKDKDLIIDAIAGTVDIDFLMKPVYNFKAVEKDRRGKKNDRTMENIERAKNN